MSITRQGGAAGYDTTDPSAGGTNNVSLGTLLENDLVVLVLGSQEAVPSPGTSTNGGIATSGYTDLHAGAGGAPGRVLAYKFMGSTPDTVVGLFADSTSNRPQSYAWAAYRGVDTSTPIDNSVSETGILTNGAMPNAPSHTTITDNAKRIIVGILNENAQVTATAPTGYGNLLNSTTGGNWDDGGLGFSSTAMMADKDEATAGAGDPAIFGGSGVNNNWAAHFALRPATAGAAAFPNQHFRNLGVYS